MANIMISRFPRPQDNRETFQVYIGSTPVCAEKEEERDAWEYARALFHKTSGNTLVVWDAYCGKQTIIDRN
jgi:hypothetical protein